MDLFWPETPEELVARLPTEEDWELELASGWNGPDGSSDSLDDIEGIRVGLTSKDYRPDLPANLHDYRYRILRRLRYFGRASPDVIAAMRKAADLENLEGNYKVLEVLIGYHGWKARRRADVRYYALRMLGDHASRPRDDESYYAVV